jgi:uncharacterized phage protein (TIGR01671 family)
MRTIKFRAWDLINRHWCGYALRGFVLIDEGNKEQEVIQWSPKRDGKILMEFTGLLDKNGKEIYEGDIVKCEQIMALVKYVVEPAIAGFVFDQDNCGAYREYAVKDGTAIHYEVIGNIYENPELLK